MMPTSSLKGFWRGVGVSVPIVLGYLPVAFSFGLVAQQLALPFWVPIVIAGTVFAGASQFVLIAMLSSSAPLWGTVAVVWLINLRHLFYGPALTPILAPDGWRLPRPLLAFGLTDEVFVVAARRLDTVPAQQRQIWFAGLQTSVYAAWVLSTVLGVRFGAWLAAFSPVLRQTLNFVLPALFFALLLEVAHRRYRSSLAVAAVVTMLLLPRLPHVAMLAGMLSGAAWGALALERRREKEAHD